MVITITGDNSYALSKEQQKLVSEFEKKYGQLAVERLDAEEQECNSIVQAIMALPFLVEKKLIIVSNPESNKELIEQLENIIDELPESNELILVQPKIDKRQNYYKILNKKTDLRVFSSQAENMTSWIKHQVQDQQGSILDADIRYLLDRVGPNQMLLANEIDKLLLYDKNITRQTINLLTQESLQGTVFQLLEAAFSKNPKQATKLYEQQRLQKVEPQAIIGLLAWQLHAMALVVAAGNMSTSEIASKTNLKPYTINKTKNIVRNMNIKDVAKLVDKLTDIDYKSKTQSYNLDAALLGYIIEIAD